jgi:DNA-binding beta-propeller fold protein YncE
MGSVLRAGQLVLGAAVAAAATPSCFAAGAGTAPPPDAFYFPVGLAVSPDGNVLYAVNSDFDLQYNGGTLQSYDLQALRKAASTLIACQPTGCPNPPPGGMPLGEACAPPTESKLYLRETAVIGAFATDIQLSVAPLPRKQQSELDGLRRRLLVPVRGDAALTWADVGDPNDPNDRFKFDCGQGADKRCDSNHRAGSDPNQSGNTRHATMPGEPFGMAQTEDGVAIAITHQTDTKTSLLTTGLPASGGLPLAPTMQFVLDGLPTGGIGIAAVPHDPDAVGRCEDPNPAPHCVRPAFLETSRNAAEIDLLRYYDDDESLSGSSLHRPFLQREAAYPIASNAIGVDSRGIVIDPTPRIACKQGVASSDTQGLAACAQLPARVFFASRTPPALGIGEIGGPPANGGTYDPDRLVLTGNVPLPNGPSNIYLAPIVDATGRFALRVFVTCFDSNQIVVYDPDAEAVENVINVGQGPFAMAFDSYVDTAAPPNSFSLGQVASRAMVPVEPFDSQCNDAGPVRPILRSYRFAYVASFTQSYVQMIDLDNSQPFAETFERVVYTLGQPTQPKGR